MRAVVIVRAVVTVRTVGFQWKFTHYKVVALQILYANVTGKVQLNGTKEVISGSATFLK